jgi:hypothetical protein
MTISGVVVLVIIAECVFWVVFGKVIWGRLNNVSEKTF